MSPLSPQPPQPAGQTDELAVHALLATLRRQHTPTAVAAGLQLQLLIDPTVPQRLCLDGAALQAVLEGLLAQALAVTQQGLIRLHASLPRPRWLRLTVEDTGPGMAPLLPLPRPGLGDVQARVQALGGALGVRSRPGAGTQVWLELPFTVAQALPSNDTERQRLLDVLRGAQVLVADHDAVSAMILEAALQHWGVAVQRADDGQQALALCQQPGPFDLLLIDLFLPGELNGLAVAARLRRHHPPTALPIVGLSASTLPGQREAALACGLNAVLPKPLDLTRLPGLLAHWVGVARGARVSRR